MLNNFKNMLQKDSYGFGAFLALISPVLSLFGFYYLFLLLAKMIGFAAFSYEQLYLLSLMPNVLLMRYYLSGAKLMKTGKSILIVTFIWVVLFFYFS